MLFHPFSKHNVVLLTNRIRKLSQTFRMKRLNCQFLIWTKKVTSIFEEIIRNLCFPYFVKYQEKMMNLWFCFIRGLLYNCNLKHFSNNVLNFTKLPDSVGTQMINKLEFLLSIKELEFFNEYYWFSFLRLGIILSSYIKVFIIVYNL